MARRYALCFFAALFLSLALAWLIARWWPAATLDRALWTALCLPLLHVLLMLWLWFSPQPRARWLRIAGLGLICALAIGWSTTQTRPATAPSPLNATPAPAALPA